MILLRSHEKGDWFLENSHLCRLGMTRQGSEASWLTYGHFVVELHADQHGTLGFDFPVSLDQPCPTMSTWCNHVTRLCGDGGICGSCTPQAAFLLLGPALLPPTYQIFGKQS
jgi:hypothetical protein